MDLGVFGLDIRSQRGIPPLRGSARQKTARKKQPGRFSPFDFAQGKRNDRFCFGSGEERSPGLRPGLRLGQGPEAGANRSTPPSVEGVTAEE